MNAYAVLRIRDYARFLMGFSAVVVGMEMLDIAVAWELYERTHSAAMLGLIGLAQGVPAITLALLAGHIVDQNSRKKVLALSLSVTALCGFALAGVSRAHGPVWLVFAVMACMGAARAFRSPSMQALVPRLVPPSLLGSAMAWRSSVLEVSAMAGPMAGGFLIAWTHNYPLIYALNGILCLAFLGAVLSLTEQPGGVVAAIRRGARDEILAGARFIFRSPPVLAMMTLDMFAVLLGGAAALLPIFANDILHVGATGLGWLRAAPALGAFTMAILQAHLPARLSPLRRPGPSLLWAVVGFGAATVVFGVSRSFWLSMAMLFLTGVFDNVSVVIRLTGVMLLTPDSMRGRVASVNSIFIGMSNELGAFESGITAAAFGPVASVVAGGLGAIATVVAVMRAWPELRSLQPLEGEIRA